MNAALRLISGDGELENGWKRLFGMRRGRPSVSGTGVDAKPAGLRNSGGSLLTVCPCGLRDDTARLPNALWSSCCFACTFSGNLMLFSVLVETLLAPRTSCLVRVGCCRTLELILRAFKHL